MNFPLGKSLITLTLTIVSIATIASCKGGSDPAISLNGKTYTERDLKNDPAAMDYIAFKKQYNDRLFDILQSYTTQKLFELEAKEKKVNVKEYVNSLYASVQEPTAEEVQKRYNDLKNAGRIKESYREIEQELKKFMMQEKASTLVENELNRLKKKFHYKEHIKEERQKVSVTSDDFTRGPNNAKVTIVEYTDYECPYCLRAQATTTQLREKYGDKIRWVFKDFPLNFHKNAMGAHIAARCVGKQDRAKFWNFSDSLFTSQENRLSPANLNRLAAATGINMTEWSKCIQDPAMEAKVHKSIEEGASIGVSGTPAFFINGIFLSGARDISEFEIIIDREL